jgi:hypothetical protein
MTRVRQLAVRLALTLPALCGLAGCTFGPHLTQDDREAVSDCRQESDRIFAVRNRYQISERDSSDTPFSANSLPSNPTAGLRDQYERDQLLDNCLSRSAAGDEAVPGSAAAPAAH